MSEETGNRTEQGAGLSRAVAVLGGLLFLLALYVLSVGPVAWMVRHWGMPMPGAEPFWLTALMYLYAPLEWVADSGTPPGDWLRAYAEWWTGGP